MATNYTFSISLLDASQNSNTLTVWQSGTLTVDTGSAPAVSGALTLPDYYKEPIPYEGTIVPPETMSGTIVTGSGESSEAQITFTLVYRHDGFLYIGTYLGGIVSMLDFSAQETYTYVIQGLTPQGPYGTAQRGGTVSVDKRKASISAQRSS